MRLRDIAEDRAFRLLVGMGVLVGTVTLLASYVETGEFALVGLVGFVSLVALVGAFLVTYWNRTEHCPETE